MAAGESARPQPAEPVARPAPPSEFAVPPVRREAARVESLRPPSEPSPPRVAQGEAKPAAPEQKAIPPEPTPETKPASPKNVLDSLEQEMASLLGRPIAKE
jgi:hypothetical protein